MQHFSNWRAIAHTSYGTKHLLYMGGSMEHVKKNFPGAFHEILTPDEQMSVLRVSLERWSGKMTAGYWKHMENTKIPRIYHKVAQ